MFRAKGSVTSIIEGGGGGSAGDRKAGNQLSTQ